MSTNTEKKDFWDELLSPEPIQYEEIAAQPTNQVAEQTPPIDESKPVTTMNIEVAAPIAPQKSIVDEAFTTSLTKEELKTILENKDGDALIKAIMQGKAVILSRDVSDRYKAAARDLTGVFLPTLTNIASAFNPLESREKDVLELLKVWGLIAPTIKKIQNDSSKMNLMKIVPVIIAQGTKVMPVVKKVWAGIDTSALTRIDWASYESVFDRYDIDLSGFRLLEQIFKSYTRGEIDLSEIGTGAEGEEDDGLFMEDYLTE